MRRKNFFGVVVVILGLFIAIGPFALFHVCKPENPQMNMSCHDTARAELGLGIVISIWGFLIALSKRREFTAGLTVALLLNALLVIVIPDFLIGVCSGEHMHCRAAALPALNILGAVLLLIAAGSLIQFKRNERRIKNEP